MPKPQKGNRRYGKHGRTRCDWCDAKIARGKTFCNPNCHMAYRRFNSNTVREEPQVITPEQREEEIERTARLMKALWMAT